jgi:hypothetical protein
MAREAKAKDLLYVSDAEDDNVDVYSYPKGKLEGQLGGFAGVQGICADKSGNVWITNQSQETILEYAHGGTAPIATLNDSGYHPGACSVDPSTGNLAVANLDSDQQEGPGGLALYADAKGSPTLYSDTALTYALYVGYDGSGDAFVDGQGTTDFVLAKLAKGGSTLQSVSLSGISGIAGGIAWDGKYITVASQNGPAIYQLTVSASGAATIVGTTTLSGPSSIQQYAMALKPRAEGKKQATSVVVPQKSGSSAGVGFYAYPAGGAASKNITGLGFPLAAAISWAK